MRWRFVAFAATALLALAQQQLPNNWRIQPVGTQVPVGPQPMSAAISPDGKFILVLNRGSISIVAADSMRETSRVPIADDWQGIAFAPDGQRVFIGGGSRGSVYEATFSAQGELKVAREFLADTDFVGDVAISPDGKTLLAADLFHDRIVKIDAQTGRATERFKTGRRPYRILFAPDAKSYFVSSWADASIFEHTTDTGAEVARLRVGPHPAEMAISTRKIPEEVNPWQYRLFVALANTNEVSVVGVGERGDLTPLDNLNIGFTARQPSGMTPSGLALSADQTQLLIACSDANVIAVADISESRSRLAGFVPTGIYPVAVKMLADNRVAIVTQSGNLAFVDPITDEALAKYTDTVVGLTPYRDAILESRADERSSINHVVYILTEGKQTGTAPNHRQLAISFVKYDNFHVIGSNAAEAVSWAMSAIANDFIRRMGGHLKPETLQGKEPANSPPAADLWTNAESAGLVVRSYDAPATFLNELKQSMPQLSVIRLRGTDADAQLGQIAEAVSHSRFWPSTAIFAIDVDPQNAGLLTISPFARRGVIDRNSYDTLSVLRTIELILDLHPMTMFDAAARPIGASFVANPDNTPYTAERATQ